ncbi:MAG TPA: DotU family type IV/VI secretion system protein [Victivallales bacterium]|nr:DotU family type IV/VI secretion system protein [Victivallales bacterium]
MEKIRVLNNISSLLNEVNMLSKSLQTEASMTDHEMIEQRDFLRTKLKNLWLSLDSDLGQHNAHFIIFALVAYIDETITTIFVKKNMIWPKLQKEMFDINVAGEKFYQLLDALLSDPLFPKTVHYTFYLILKFGFEGELIDRGKKTKKSYMKELEEIIKANIPDNRLKQDISVKSIFTWKYYVAKYYIPIVAAVVAIVYFSSLYFLTAG